MASTLPYPGLRPFHRDETDIFFGREEQTDQLLEKLGTSRFLAVVGPSGCGKSSLVRAGMIGALETGFMARAGARWRIAVMRPGSHPIRRLTEALLDDSALGPERAGEPHAREFLHATLERGPLGLTEALQETPLPEGTNLLLLVDQFEEIFRFRREDDTDEADAFVALLLETAAQHEVPVYVVITMRSDYLGDCATFSGLPEALNENQYLTPRLTRDERRAAITGPARVFGGDVDPHLVNRLLNETGADPAQLPVLQHLLMRMWLSTRPVEPSAEKPEAAGIALLGDVPPEAIGHRLTIADYERVGGLDQALSQHADEAFASLDDIQKRIAEILFRSLCERGADQRDTRRPTPVREIAARAGVTPEQILTVVEVFRSPRYGFLVPAVPESIYANTMLDISHESLISRWKRLNQWVEDEAKSAETYRFLEQSARLWKVGRAALWGTPDLENALDWKEREKPTPEWAERYGGNFGLAMEFLEASQQKRKADREKAETARRTQLVRAYLIAGLSVLALVVVSVLAAWGIWQKNRAEAAKTESFARELAANAINNLDNDPELSILLAWEGVKQSFSSPTGVLPVATRALRRTVQSSRLRLTLDGHRTNLLDLAFSPDGAQIATAAADRTAKIWDASSGKELFTLYGHTAYVQSVAFSPDGKRIATASGDAIAIIWDRTSGKKVRSLKGHLDQINDVAFSPDGSLVATAGEDGFVKLWDSATGEELRTFAGHVGNVEKVAFSRDGRLATLSSADDSVRIWDFASGWELRRIEHDRLTAIAFSPDDTHIATGDLGGELTIWNSYSGRKIDKLQAHPTWVTDLTYSPDGRRIATSSYDGTAKVWDVASQSQLFSLSAHTSRETPGGLRLVMAVAFSPDGTLIATAADAARVWTTIPFEEGVAIPAHTRTIRKVAVSPDGKYLASASQDGSAKVWDAATGKMRLSFDGHKGAVRGIAFHPTGTQIATASSDGTAKVWELASQETLRELSHGAGLNDIAFDHQGTRLATTGDDSTTVIWDIQTGQKLATLSGHTDRVLDVAFSPDGKRVATASQDYSAKVWDTASGDLVKTLGGHAIGLLTVTYSPDGSLIATGSKDKTIILWDAESGAKERTLTGHKASVYDVTFSPDGTRLASGADDGVKFWDVKSGDLVESFSGDLAHVRSVIFASDGRFLAAAGADGVIRTLALPVDNLVEVARRRVTRPLTPDECEDYLHMKDCPTTAMGLIVAGKELVKKLKPEEAEAAFQRALELDPGLEFDPHAMANKLLASWMLTVAASVMEELTAGLTSGSMSKDEFSKKLDQALKLLTLAMNRDPEVRIEPESYLLNRLAMDIVRKGRKWAKEANVERATSAFEMAARLADLTPLPPRAYAKNLAASAARADAKKLIRKKKNMQTAIQILDKVVELDPNNHLTYLLRGQAFRELRDYDQAIGNLTKANEIRPTADAYLELAYVYHDKKSKEGYMRARNAAKKALELNPKHPYAKLVLGMTLYQLKEYRGALAHLKNLTGHPGLDSFALNVSGSIYAERYFQYELAYEKFAAAKELNPSDIGIRQNYAESCFETRRFEQSYRVAMRLLDDYEQGKKFGVHPLVMRFFVIGSLLLQGDGEEAHKELEKFVTYYNKVVDGYALGWSFRGVREFIKKQIQNKRQRELLSELTNLLEHPKSSVTLEAFEKYFNGRKGDRKLSEKKV